MTTSARVPSNHPVLPTIALLLAIAGCAAQPDGADGVLTFHPSTPTASEVITVEYRPVSELRGEDRLRLRARFRTPRDEQYNFWSHQVSVTELKRGRGSVFQGSFALPAEAVFAAFAVEDLTGERVDHNGQALWELLVHGADGRPLGAALEQKSNDLTGRNWQEAHRASRERHELYPDDLEARLSLLFFQQQVLGPDSFEVAMVEHRATFGRLDEEYRDRSDLDAERLGLMWWYALYLEDTTLINRWKQRLVEEAPASRYGVGARMERIDPQVRRDPAKLLEMMDGLWEDGVRLNGDLPTYFNVVQLGLRAAMKTGDEAAVRRWLDRNARLAISPWTTRGSLARNLIEHAVLTEDAIRLVEEELSEYETDPHTRRILTHSVSEHRRALEARILRDLVTLGRGRLALADTNAARAAFQDASARRAWNASRFTDLGQALLELGDVDAAAAVAARVAVDPERDGGAADSVIDAVRGHVSDSRWRALKTEAEAMMRHVTNLEDVNRALPADPTVETADGRETLFSETMDGQITLIAFWSRSCGPSVEELPQLQETAAALSEIGVRTLAITDEAASPELAEFLDGQGLDLPIYHDVFKEASLALKQYATPRYYVLDGRGRLRFENTSVDAVRRQVRALEREGG